MSFQGLSDFSDREICDSTGIDERSLLGDKTGRKSDPKPRVPTRPRVRFVETTPECISATKKRGRDRPKAKLDGDDESAEEEEDAGSRKKGRKSNGATRKVSPSPASSSDRAITIVEFLEPSTMKKWQDRPSWERYIKVIEAVQRKERDVFYFFTLKGEKTTCREHSRVCSEKFPITLMGFYESHTRRRTLVARRICSRPMR